jgi:hypothetical protein
MCAARSTSHYRLSVIRLNSRYRHEDKVRGPYRIAASVDAASLIQGVSIYCEKRHIRGHDITDA